MRWLIEGTISITAHTAHAWRSTDAAAGAHRGWSRSAGTATVRREAGEFLFEMMTATGGAGNLRSCLRRTDDLLKIRAALVADKLANRHLPKPPKRGGRLKVHPQSLRLSYRGNLVLRDRFLSGC